jgi:Ca2+-transporting ATPase
MPSDSTASTTSVWSRRVSIALGTGTQVAKNAGKMILTDDNFATIVRAVFVGRKVYDNMLKYIRFMLVALVTYVVTFLMAQPARHRRRSTVHGRPDPVDQLPDHRSGRHRPITTVGLAGLFMSVAINVLIVLGKNEYDSTAIGSTMGLVAFSLMLVIAAFEC